jgi:hypothetical protein
MLSDELNKAIEPKADTLRGAITFMAPDCVIDCLLTREQIMARPVVSFNHGDARPRTYTLAPNHCHVKSSAKESKRGE